jgi:hypothetical protein
MMRTSSKRVFVNVHFFAIRPINLARICHSGSSAFAVKGYLCYSAHIRAYSPCAWRTLKLTIGEAESQYDQLK